MNEHERCEFCGGSGRCPCPRCQGGCSDCGRSGEVECLFCVVYPRRIEEEILRRIEEQEREWEPQ